MCGLDKNLPARSLPCLSIKLYGRHSFATERYSVTVGGSLSSASERASERHRELATNLCGRRSLLAFEIPIGFFISPYMGSSVRYVATQRGRERYARLAAATAATAATAAVDDFRPRLGARASEGIRIVPTKMLHLTTVVRRNLPPIVAANSLSLVGE